MRKSDRYNLTGESLMHTRHQDRGNEKKVNVGETRTKDNTVSNGNSKEATLHHNKIDDHNRHLEEKQQKPV